MLQVDSFRETRVYQEAFEEGVEKGIEKGIEEGIEKGIEKGAAKTKDEIARSLLSTKLPIEEIAKATGLSLAQIKKLKKKTVR